MKIIQSYWTKPSLKKSNLNNSDRNKGGWLDKRFNYFSWTLSVLKFREYFEEVELYTDELGAEFLIGKLELPYSKVHVVLDEMNRYDHDLWAIGKLYVYGLQTTPFLHVDGDVFIWEKFDKELLAKDLITQNLEDAYPYYQDIYASLSKEFSFVPDYITNYHNQVGYFSGVNAGVLGGNNISFIHKYVSSAFQLVDKNIDHIKKIDTGLFNNFFEQCLFRLLADTDNIEISVLLDEVNDRFDYLVDFTGVPANTGYIHTVGDYKKRLETGRLLAFKIKEEYPDYYFKIIELLKKNAI